MKFNLPAIVVSAYNRVNSLERLLGSISRASYPINESINLVISIDGGGGKEREQCVVLAESFEWGFGHKLVIDHPSNLGLRSHILYCYGLSEIYGSCIVLEDDLVVAPSYYFYAQSALSFYSEDDTICGIALYSYRINESAECAPFCPLNNGSDTYFMQVPCSWGQVWTARQSQLFTRWLSSNPVFTGEERLPEEIKSWKDSSWKKMMFKYMVENDKYFVYPYVSFSTNFADSGVNVSKEGTSVWMTSLISGIKESYHFIKFSKQSIVYDSYMELIPDSFICLGLDGVADLCVDLYGTKQVELFHEQTWLTSKGSLSPVDSFSLRMFPLENNILFGVKGNDFVLTSREHLLDVPREFTDKLGKVYSLFAYNSGQVNIRLSRSYKIGRILLDVLRFRHIRSLCNANNS